MSSKAMIHLGDDAASALQRLRSSGAQVLAQYGASALVRADASQLEQIAASGLRVRELAAAPLVGIGGFQVDTLAPAMRSASATAVVNAAGQSRQVLRLAGPLHPDWKTRLEQLGVHLHQALTEDTYLCSIIGHQVDEVQALDFVESVLAYEPALKVNAALLSEDTVAALAASTGLTLTVRAAPPPAPPEPRAVARRVAGPSVLDSREMLSRAADPEATSAGNLELLLFDAGELLAAADAVRAAGASVIRAQRDRLIVQAPLSLLPALAALHQVREINPFEARRLTNNVASGLMHVDELHTDFGLDGAGQIVGIADTGLDTGVNDATMLDDFEGRIVSIFALGRPGNASDTNGHGTHVAGSVLGNGANSNQRVRGTAPAARLVFQSIMDNAGGLGGIPADVGVGLFDVARNQGARIHSNSWGAPVNGAYNGDSSDADAFAFANRGFLICFSAGNEGTKVANKIGSPGTAKNVLTIGASESLRTLPASVNFPPSPMFPGGATLPNVAIAADNQNDVAAFSSIGPAQNNRRKPDVVAPGTWILSTRSSLAVADVGPDGLGGTGDEDGTATHAEAVGLGLPGQPILFAGNANAPAMPPGSGAAAAGNYMFQSGTSMATPLTAGACVLLRQYLVEQRGHMPSAALIKAMMVNGAVDMGAGVPNNSQGWGRVDLLNTLSPAATKRTQFDDSLDSAVATGDIRTYDVFVSSATAPLAVTLAWRDPAGNTIQNRLHLRVTHVASGTTQTSDAIADIRNNVQKVIVAAPTAGLWRVEVEGVNVITGIVEWLPALRQDYALVVSNATGFSCNPADIVQVIDRSGSMGFSGYMEPAKDRARQFIDLLQINDKAGVVTFNSTASAPLPLTLVDNQSVKNLAHAAINPLTASGNTDLREGLELGVATLGADLGRPRALIFLSDGKHTSGPPLIDDPFLDSIAAAAIKVHTIAIGPDSDLPTLNNIASRTGTGAVHFVESAADLHKLHEIYYSIAGGAGCGGVVHLNSMTVGVAGAADSAAIDATTSQAHFALSWQAPGAEIELVLTEPGGATLNPSTTRAFVFSGSAHTFYRVDWPRAGTWRMTLKVIKNPTGQPLKATLAVLADSQFHCQARVHRKFLFQNQLRIEHVVRLGDKPVTAGQAFADVTFPTRSIADLLKRHAAALKEIKIGSTQLAKDKASIPLLQLGVLLAQQGAMGKDLFARQTVRVPLLGAGKAGKPIGGSFSGSLDLTQAKVAGPFQVRVGFEIKQAKLGTHRCVELLPVYVPGKGE